MASTPIEDYALLSDRHGSALVSRDGVVDWLSLPRFDSPAVFAGLLDPTAGHWWIRPVGQYVSKRRYLDQTMVLETTFDSADGTVTLTDAMSLGSEDDPHQMGRGAPALLARMVRCGSGRVELDLDFAPRPEYGLVTPFFTVVQGGVTARGGPVALALSGSVHLPADDQGVSTRFVLEAGQQACFALNVSDLANPPRIFSPDEIAAELDATIRAWGTWSGLHQRYQGPWHDLVSHSGRVLQALSYQPTGAIVAAPTTSLPEEPGGERNWDYRYTWIRDSAFTMDALWVAACPDEAEQFFAFMTSAATTQTRDGHLRIMYGIGGEYDLTERELPHLAGWRESRPVRVGNGAAAQHQVDVYGELLATAARFEDQLDGSDPALVRFLVLLADTAARVWREPDQGIWEIRGAPRHFVYSKLMCWVALDSAVHLAARIGASDKVAEWIGVREEIRTAIETEGWSDSMGAFTQAFGSDELDASALMMPIVGFIAADDPRMLSTIDAICEHLTDSVGLVYRYRAATGVDGLRGEEGTFILCTFWLAQALAMAGRTGRAREAFELAIGSINDVGLLAEQVDPVTGALWGNFPQAFSHIGLVNAAYAISVAEAAGS
ncbi:MAG: glycoside hydrolase family 15 protein [Candidatus Nanopelagicales bacterium]|nr:glycoside hydrolase family 15 protein [Candidatus Nanopelagicales bacterium]